MLFNWIDYRFEKTKITLGAIRKEIDESGEAGKLILRKLTGHNLTGNEIIFLKQQLRDIGVSTVLVTLIVSPGGFLILWPLLRLANKYDVDILTNHNDK